MGSGLHLADPAAPRPDPDELPTRATPASRARLGHRRGPRPIAAAGTDPEQAHAAAERCIAAYTALAPDEGQG